MSNEELRDFYCRKCDRAAEWDCIPEGWYNIFRSGGERDLKIGLGIYCSIECLKAAVDGPISSNDRRLGTDWVNKVYFKTYEEERELVEDSTA